MSDFINKQTLCDYLREYKVNLTSVFSSDESEVKGYNDGIDLAISVIAKFPSAEPKHTAKVENIQVEWGDDEYINDRMGAMYHYGNCGNCGKTVSHSQKYCHECGARLEWK